MKILQKIHVQYNPGEVQKDTKITERIAKPETSALLFSFTEFESLSLYFAVFQYNTMDLF